MWSSGNLSSTPFSEAGFVGFPNTTRLDGGPSNINALSNKNPNSAQGLLSSVAKNFATRVV